MNIIDSSAWLEFFTDSKHARCFEKIIQNTENLLIPSITIFEVFKKILIESSEDLALKCIAHMQQSKIIELNENISIEAAVLSKKHKLPMADSIIYATALKFNATIYTLGLSRKLCLRGG